MDIRSIRITMGLVFAALMLVGGLSVTTSLWVTRAQQHDALVINLAGRQRMLSQKTAKEAWLGVLRVQDPRYLTQMHATAHQFEEGLQALMDGGQVSYAGATVSVPPAADHPAFRAALEEVAATWGPLHTAAHGVLENEPGSPSFTQAAADLERLSDVILEKMDAAMRVYQVAAEARVTRLRQIQLAFLLIGGLVLLLSYGLILFQVLRPVNALEVAVRRMEEGDLDAPVRVHVRNELGRLASAFEGMRGRVKARITEQAALLGLSQAFLATLEPQAIMDRTVQTATQALGVDQCALLMLEEDGESLICAATNGWAKKLVGTGRVGLGDSDVGYAVREKQPVIIEDTARETRFPVPPMVIEHGVKSALIVPMLVGDEAVGALAANSLQRRTFTDDETHLLSLIVNQAAIAIENVRLYEKVKQELAKRKQSEEQVRRHAEEIEVAGQIFQSLNASPQMSESFPAVAASLRAITHCERASIALLDEGGETFTMFVLDQPRPELPQGVTMNVAETSAASDVLAGRPHLTPDLAAEADRPGERALYEAGYRSRINLPLVVGGKILGALNLGWNEPEGYDLEQLPLLEQIAGAVALALERTRLLQAEQQQRREVEHLYQLSSDLVATDDVETVFDTVVHHVVDAAHVTFCRLVTLEEGGAFVCRSAHSVRALDRDLGVGQPEPQALWLIYRRALAQADPWVLHPDHPDLSEEERQALFLDRVHSLSLAPLRVGGEAIGLLILGETRHPERESFSAAKLSLLTAIARQAASAIHRAMLHHQTERRMRWLTALRNIDLAITSSLDPRVTLNVLLDQATTQLNIHAAAVLLLNPHNQTLEYATGRGFRANAIRRSRVRVGAGHAGRAALERKVVHIPNLAATDEFLRASLLVGEDIVSYYAAPLISKGQVKGVLELFHRTPHEASEEWLEFLETLAGQAAIAIDNAELFDQLHRSNVELTLAYDETLEGWARALELRDYETEGHSRRVTEMTVQLARAMGLSEAELVHVRRGALLHDIGKMGIPDSILLKPGKLTDEEWELMVQHPVYAYNFLAPIDYLRPALDIPYCHHEKWDGSGYPHGLKGEQIPKAARIFAVVDVWDALSSDRPYRKAWPKKKVLQYLKEQSGLHFDPAVVKVFLELI